ncbi:uncharacterized protein METZ01_LOCUS511377 [marine metagenome]|uniref:Uncharacterized protein n=1 Tax=marine metagenome TaxID=408172 RepID=A0A383EPY7_9ZZZZ
MPIVLKTFSVSFFSLFVCFASISKAGGSSGTMESSPVFFRFLRIYLVLSLAICI